MCAREKAVLRIKEQFRTLDSDFDGSLDPEETKQLFLKINSNLTQRQLDKLFCSIDLNKNGRIELDEYLDFIFKGESGKCTLVERVATGARPATHSGARSRTTSSAHIVEIIIMNSLESQVLPDGAGCVPDQLMHIYEGRWHWTCARIHALLSEAAPLDRRYRYVLLHNGKVFPRSSSLKQCKGKGEESKEIHLTASVQLKDISDVNKALRAIRALRDEQLAELASMEQPPTGVRVTLEVVCKMLDIQPAMEVKDAVWVPDYWTTARESLLTTVKELTFSLWSLDVQNSNPDAILDRVSPCLHDPSFNPLNLEEFNDLPMTCKLLRNWSYAIIHYIQEP